MRISSLSLVGSALNAVEIPAGGASPSAINQLAIVDSRLVVGAATGWDEVLPLDSDAPLFAFTSHTFTNAGKTGHEGPSLEQLRTAYADASWAANVNYLDCRNGVQIFTVPQDGLYEISVSGASHGNLTTGNCAATTKNARFNLTRGTKLAILVGQHGSVYPGVGTDAQIATGGGGTFVHCPDLSNNPLLVSGGVGGSTTSTYGQAVYRSTSTVSGKYLLWNGTSSVWPEPNASINPPNSFGGEGRLSAATASKGGGCFSAPEENTSPGMGRSFMLPGSTTEYDGRGGEGYTTSSVPVNGGFGGGGSAHRAGISASNRLGCGGGGYSGGVPSFGIASSSQAYAIGGSGGNYANAAIAATVLADKDRIYTVPTHGQCSLTYIG